MNIPIDAKEVWTAVITGVIMGPLGFIAGRAWDSVAEARKKRTAKRKARETAQLSEGQAELLIAILHSPKKEAWYFNEKGPPAILVDDKHYKSDAPFEDFCHLNTRGLVSPVIWERIGNGQIKRGLIRLNAEGRKLAELLDS